MKKQFQSAILTTGTFLALASLGQATMLTYIRDAAGGTDSSGNPPGIFLSGAVSKGVGTVNSWNGGAGAFDLELSEDGPAGYYFSLLTYCGDPYRALSVGPAGGVGGEFTVTTMGAFGYSSRTIDAIRLLWGNAFYDSLTSATKASAFQFLIWEYIADSTYDLGDGVVRVTDSNVQNQVNDWNNSLSTWTHRANLLMLDGREGNKQSFFLQQTVQEMPQIANPEPATFVLIGAGLITLVYSRRKK